MDEGTQDIVEISFRFTPKAEQETGEGAALACRVTRAGGSETTKFLKGHEAEHVWRDIQKQAGGFPGPDVIMGLSGR